MRILLKAFVVLLVLPSCLLAQDDENWPSLSYLKNDYKAVSIVTHIRIQEAEITSRIGGYENWKLVAVVLESFKGKFKRGDVIEYFHGAEAGFKREYFTGEKIVFLLAERDRDRKLHYSVLENSTLPYTKDRVRKLRLIRRASLSKRRAQFQTNQAIPRRLERLISCDDISLFVPRPPCVIVGQTSNRYCQP
jgi:hypothetical protein